MLDKKSPKPFSLTLYLLVVCAFSWPFQLLYGVLGDEYRAVLLLAMVMAGVGTYVAGAYVFRDGFGHAGWRTGKPVYYLLALLLPLLLWLLPVIVEQAAGIGPGSNLSIRDAAILFLPAFLITLVPAFGEEFSWRGYLLPNLQQRHPARKALLIHGLVTWFWHLPFLVIMAINMDGPPLLTVAVVLVVSLVPAVMHAVVFAWFRARSGSLLVVTIYHSAFDEVRDSLESTLGFGWLAENWQMLVLTVMGLALILSTHWLGKPVYPARDSDDDSATPH